MWSMRVQITNNSPDTCLPGFSFVPGHEIVGIVEHVGNAASERLCVQAGQRVAVEVFRSCRDCPECRRGEYRRCAVNGIATMFGFVDVEIGAGLWGGYATHVELPWDAMLLPDCRRHGPRSRHVVQPSRGRYPMGKTLPDTKAGGIVAILGPGIRGICAAVAAKEAEPLSSR